MDKETAASQDWSQPMHNTEILGKSEGFLDMSDEEFDGKVKFRRAKLCH